MKFGPDRAHTRAADPWRRQTPWIIPNAVPGTSATADIQTQPAGAHVLADGMVSLGLRRRADAIAAAFGAIEPTLRDLTPRQFEPSFPDIASRILRDRLDVSVPPAALRATWTNPLNLRALHGAVVLAVFRQLVERAFDRDHTRLTDGESVEALIQRWGFHAVDVSACADGRLSGVLDYILRVPPAVVAWRKSYAGAMFDIDESIRHWESIELRRWRDGRPNTAGVPTRFLKIGVYHFSSLDPRHEGCAAHGSDDGRAAGTLLRRLEEFEAAVRAIHSEDAGVATLMVGVDTDTDAIRVHIPDGAGRMSLDRVADNRDLYPATAALDREGAKAAIRDAVAGAAGVVADDDATEGMRWLCGYLLKNNIGQIDAVRSWHGGAYADAGHTERLIVVGDPIDDVQLRNLAFQAQMNTIEEGSGDLFIGISILRKRLEPEGLPVPVLANARYDTRIPGAADRARKRAKRLRSAILASHPALAERGLLHVECAVRAGEAPRLEPVDPEDARS